MRVVRRVGVFFLLSQAITKKQFGGGKIKPLLVLGIFLIRGLAIIIVARFFRCCLVGKMMAVNFGHGSTGNEYCVDVQILCAGKLEIGDEDPWLLHSRLAGEETP